MISVVDASAAAEIALYKGQADFYKTELAKSEIVIAPDLFVSEVTNTFWKYNRIMGMPDTKCVEAIQFCLELVDDFASTTSLWREVYAQSVLLEHSVYDVFYLVLARRNSGQIVSCDSKLKKLAEQMQIAVL